MKIIKAGIKFICFLFEHNLPIASADHALALFWSTFPGNKVAQYYKSARTKITYIID